nr:hypothetical protein [Lysinibacillus antri]
MKSGIMTPLFTEIIKSPPLAYWKIRILMMVISWFFWPSPTVALLGAVLLPVAIQAGLPALGVPDANKGTYYSSIFLYIMLIKVKTKNVYFTAFLVFISARNLASDLQQSLPTVEQLPRWKYRRTYNR